MSIASLLANSPSIVKKFDRYFQNKKKPFPSGDLTWSARGQNTRSVTALRILTNS